jgi:hypothetical protein
MRSQFSAWFCLVCVCFSLSAIAARPANGLWTSADDPEVGSGLFMTTQGVYTLISVFSYDEQGFNTWYMSAGVVDSNGTYEAPLWRTQNGSGMFDESPESATINPVAKQLRIAFDGSQAAMMSINGSPEKLIRPDWYGVGSAYGVMPDLTGQWVVGRASDRSSFLLDLHATDYINVPVSPIRTIAAYESQHPSTMDWAVYCINIGSELVDASCYLNNPMGSPADELFINGNLVGVRQMVLTRHQVTADEHWQGFRLPTDFNLKPADGHWRTDDDPEIGSGLVMRTQGAYTVVLVYSYAADGQPQWRIAAGQFNEQGRFFASLHTTQGGGFIASPMPASAQVALEESIEIQLQGTQLGTLSINGSATKLIKPHFFGVELFATEHLQYHGDDFAFPDQTGDWLQVDQTFLNSQMTQLLPFDLNSMQTPPDPRLVEARQYIDPALDDEHSLSFFCTKLTNLGDMNFELKPYCYGSHHWLGVDGGLKLFYQDIGYGTFRYHITDDNSGHDVSGVDRNHPGFMLFRMEP